MGYCASSLEDRRERRFLCGYRAALRGETEMSFALEGFGESRNSSAVGSVNGDIWRAVAVVVELEEAKSEGTKAEEIESERIGALDG
jgi:hypothetical protein